MQTVLDALMELRSPYALYENDIHGFVEDCLKKSGLQYKHEARIGVGCRIDYLVGDVGIEIKKGKPAHAALVRQLRRYAACDGVRSIIVLTQRSVSLPSEVCGKPVRALSLNSLWGVALP